MSGPRWICGGESASTSTAPTPRARIKEMVALATAVDHVECAHDLEAGVRELRLLAAHAPPYNRRSKFPQRWWWVVLTDEAFPRFSRCVRSTERASTAPSGRSGRVPTPSRRPSCWPGSPGCAPAPPGLRARRGTAPPAPNVNSHPARHPATSRPSNTKTAPRRAAALIDGHRPDGARLCRGAVPHHRTGRPQPLRDRRTAARPRRRRDRCAVARSAASRAGVGHRTGRSAPGRRRRLAARGDPVRAACGGGRRAPRRAADAGGRRDQRCGTSDSARPRAAGRRTGRGDGADHALAGPAGRTHRAGRTRLGVIRWGRPGGGLAGPPRPGRRGWPPSRRLDGSELLGEPHPTREQLFGRPGVDRLGGPAQPGLPRRQPFGAAG